MQDVTTLPISGDKADKDKNDDSNIPGSFICPLTLEVMTDPVIDREGNSYERSAIVGWLQQQARGNSAQVSPLTRQPLEVSDLVPNRVLKSAIEEFLGRQGVNADEARRSKVNGCGSRRISRIEILSGAVVDGIRVTYSYANHAAASTPISHGGYPDGGVCGENCISLGEDEYVVQVKVRYGTKLVQRLTFTTNTGRQLGPCGGEGGYFLPGGTWGEERLVQPPGIGHALVGIHGRAGKYLDAIGFHWAPVQSTGTTGAATTKADKLAAASPLFGGAGGEPFDHGHCGWIGEQLPAPVDNNEPSTSWTSQLASVVGIGVGSIDIATTQSHYHPGDDVVGNVKLDLENPVQGKGLFVVLLATQKRYRVRITDDGKAVPTHRVETLYYFEKQICGKKMYESGMSMHRFHMHIPSRLEPEIKDTGIVGNSLRAIQSVRSMTDGPIRWTLKASLSIPWKVGLSQKVHLSVDTYVE